MGNPFLVDYIDVPCVAWKKMKVFSMGAKTET